MSINFWECNGCKRLFTARELYPCQWVDNNLEVHHFMLCRHCLTEYQDQNGSEYVDDFKDLEIPATMAQ